MTLGPQNRTKTRSTYDANQQDYQTIDNGTRRTQEVHQQTSRMRNHSTIQEPLRCIILLHQEKEQQVETCTRLLTNQ
jgi:hypothetical protein